MTYFYDFLGGLRKMVSTDDNSAYIDEEIASQAMKEKKTRKYEGSAGDNRQRIIHTGGNTMMATSAVLTGVFLASIVVYRAVKMYRAS